MRGTPGIPDVLGWDLPRYRSTGIGAGGEGAKGGFLFFLLSEEKQFQLQGKLGTSTKATTVMSSSTKRNINRRRRWSEQQQRCSEMRAALERLCSPFE